MSAAQGTPTPFHPTADADESSAAGTSTARSGLRFGVLLAGMLVTGAMTAPSALAAADYPPGPTVAAFPPGPSIAAYPPGPSMTGDPAPTHDGVIIHEIAFPPGPTVTGDPASRDGIIVHEAVSL